MDEALERNGNGRGQERRGWTRLGFGGLVDRADEGESGTSWENSTDMNTLP